MSHLSHLPLPFPTYVPCSALPIGCNVICTHALLDAHRSSCTTFPMVDTLRTAHQHLYLYPRPNRSISLTSCLGLVLWCMSGTAEQTVTCYIGEFGAACYDVRGGWLLFAVSWLGTPLPWLEHKGKNLLFMFVCCSTHSRYACILYITLITNI